MPTLPYGTWPSPITPALVAAQGLRLGAVSVDGDDLYWTEGRALEGGRSVLVRRRSDGRIEDVTPAPFNVRTRVHEYGGGAYVAADGVVYFSNFADQRIYRVVAASASVAAAPPVPAEAITPEGPWCYADACVDARRRRLICVREARGAEHINTIVAVAFDGEPTAGVVLVEGDDFYSTPRLRPDGTQLAWLSWRHPRMPWDGTELWVADVAADGSLDNRRLIAGGRAESIYQPGWSPDGRLHFVSDRDGWWRIYRVSGAPGAKADRSGIEAVLANPPAAAEFGRPQWIFGTSTWAFAGPARMAVSYTQRGCWRLATIDLAARTLTDLPAIGAGERRPPESALSPHDWLVATPRMRSRSPARPPRPTPSCASAWTMAPSTRCGGCRPSTSMPDRSRSPNRSSFRPAGG